MRRGVLRAVAANRCVCLVELAFSGFNMAEYGVWVSVLVYAYERGGTSTAAIVAFVQLVPAAVAAPLLARATDRRDPARALRRAYWWQFAALGATSLLAYFATPDLLVYASATLAAAAVTATRPAQAALVARLAVSSDELTAINVVSGWVESVSILAGPALAGAVIGPSGAPASIGLFAVLTLATALLTTRVASPCVEGAAPPPSGLKATEQRPRGAPAGSWRQGHVPPLVAVLGAQYFVIGMLDVLLVVLAIRVLGLGPSGPGYLTAAFGAGGVLGSFATVSLIGRQRLVSPLLAAGFASAALLVALGGWTTAVGAFLMLPAAGLARSLLDVCGRTMLLQSAPADHRGRIFGLLESVAMAGLALGSLSVPLFTAAGGTRASLIVTGSLLSVITVVAAVPLTREVAGLAERQAVPAVDA